VGIAGKIRILKVVKGIHGRVERAPGLFFQPCEKGGSIPLPKHWQPRQGELACGGGQKPTGLLPPSTTSGNERTASVESPGTIKI
jgi:hypothetical protein